MSDPMARLSSFAVFTTVLVAFVAMASHLGMMDHSSMDNMAAAAAPAAMASGMPNATAIPAADQSMPAQHPMPAHPHGSGIAIVMICDLMVLVTAIGFLLIHLLKSWQAQWTTTIRDRLTDMPAPPVLPSARPPGLSMLCVVRC